MLSSLWDGMSIATARETKTVLPTPIPTNDLIPPPNLSTFNNSFSLPREFIWGWAATAQSEGAVTADNRGPSIWDTMAHKVPGFITGVIGRSDQAFDVTNNHYYLYKQDAMRLRALGIPYYSMTISWTRIFPLGNGTVNQAGIQHYIDEVEFLTRLGITPIVTLYHWDMPQALQNWYGGWLDRKIVEDFSTYAKVVFTALSPKVKIWITLNEPQVICNDYASFPEKVPADTFRTFGMSMLQRKYQCGHFALLAHARAVEIFRKEIEPVHGKGIISFANSWDFTPPFTSSLEDHLASERSLSFSAGWFSNPVYINGDYPSTMKATLGHLLPTFTPAEQKLLLGSADFYAWDAYTGYPVRAPTTAAGGTVAECVSNPNHDNWPKCAEEVMVLPNGWIIGTKSDDGTAGWLHDTPNYF